MTIEDKLVKVLEAKPFGIKIAQTWIQIGLMFQLIEDLKLGTVIELGVFCGGLADLLIRRSEMVKDIRYFGFENNPGPIEHPVRDHWTINIADVFAQETVAHVSALMSGDARPALIFCDDGDKPKEMRTYAPVLRPGDYMLAHDYPGETTPQSLANFGVDRMWMSEIDPPIYRHLGVSLWKRTS